MKYSTFHDVGEHAERRLKGHSRSTTPDGGMSKMAYKIILAIIFKNEIA